MPVILPETAPFWEAAERGELVFQQCRCCGEKIWFPRVLCYRCLSEELSWVKASGRGIVYSYTIIRQTWHEGFVLPYVYAIIELSEGVRMISNVVGVDPEAVRIGMNVKVVFEVLAPGVAIPKFEPIRTHEPK